MIGTRAGTEGRRRAADGHEHRPGRPPRRRHGPAALALAALVAGGLLAAGCGGSGDSGEAGAASGTEQREQFQEAALDYAGCMRDEGIDMPDPQVGEGGGIAIQRAPGGAGPDTPGFEEADEKCREHMESARPPEIDEEQRAEMQEAMLAFARCMRAEGIDMPDPDFDGGRTTMRLGGEDFDPEDPAFRAAQEKCREELPDGGPGAMAAPRR